MKNAELVRSVDAVGDLPQKPDGSLYGQSSLAAEQLVQRLALDVFHHEIKNAVGTSRQNP